MLQNENPKINLKIFRKISYYLSHLNSTHVLWFPTLSERAALTTFLRDLLGCKIFT